MHNFLVETSSTDGVVIDSVFLECGTGAYQITGRTGTSWVGHWMNLRHIWEMLLVEADLVNDTPT
jgi:hypothetical protein